MYLCKMQIVRLRVIGLSHGRVLLYDTLSQGIWVQIGSSASSTFLTWNSFARSSMESLSLSLMGVAAHVTLSDQNTLTSELWEGEKGNFLKVWSCAFLCMQNVAHVQHFFWSRNSRGPEKVHFRAENMKSHLSKQKWTKPFKHPLYIAF